jgi:hypothetical protein
MCWALIGGAVTLGIMLWTFAPWIPVLRETVPGVRRMRQLEVFWTDGRNLERERVTSDEQFKDWHSASWGEQLSNVVDEKVKRQAATFSSVISVSSSVTLMPSLKVTSLSTSATSSWPLNRRQRSWAASSSL